ncbi:hypothetical protein JCM33374_g424 [Metschnikowia sp. JCM 33374]|nr:hypothetical protein JCM33374_g424 [Metschnikowia sp. JCM 33374]
MTPKCRTRSETKNQASRSPSDSSMSAEESHNGIEMGKANDSVDTFSFEATAESALAGTSNAHEGGATESRELLHASAPNYSYEPSEYRGTMVKPLNGFGTLNYQPESFALRWINDHTSGNVHKDMPLISMLYNQNLILPEPAQKFIEQSPELLDEARWERLKAVFYGLYPANIQTKAYQILSGLSALEASRIIAKKTSRFAHEVILHPLSEKSCDEQDAASLNREIPEMIEELLRVFTGDFERFQTHLKSLGGYRTYGTSRDHSSEEDIRSVSQHWVESITSYFDTQNWLLEKRVLLFHFQHAEARFDPRTQWIHVKTRLLDRDSDESEHLPREILQLPLLQQYERPATSDEVDAEVACQMETFETGLMEYGTGSFKTFDAKCHNGHFEGFDFHVPYTRVSPSVCGSVLNLHCRYLPPEAKWEIVSKPVIWNTPKQYHSMRVYFDATKLCGLATTDPAFDSKLTPIDKSPFCLNCFSKNHRRVSYTKPQFGFAIPNQSVPKAIEM